MDAFYASVEQHDHPHLKGKPVAVGGSAARGVVAAASYEARKFGVFSAMSSALAARKCPGLIFVKPRFDRYKEVSQMIRSIFHDYTDLVEPLSLDEAYLDVTSNKHGIASATLIAQEIKKRIKEETGLTASAGISINKFLAKTASDVNKPDGLFLIKPDDAEGYVEKLPIQKFHGIGKVTAERMIKMGVYFGKDLKSWSEEALTDRFGKAGRYYFKIARAIDDRAVTPDRLRKSIGAENTFRTDVQSMEDIREKLDAICTTLIRRIETSGRSGRTLTLKIKYDDFNQITRSRTVDYLIQKENELKKVRDEILNEFEPERPIRLLGLSLSNLNTEEENVPTGPTQLTLSF